MSKNYLGGSTIIKAKRGKGYYAMKRKLAKRNNEIHNDLVLNEKLNRETAAEWEPEFFLIKKDIHDDNK